MVGHLVEQRRDGVVTAVQDQQQRRNFSLPEVEQLVFLRDDLLQPENCRLLQENHKHCEINGLILNYY